MIYTANSFSGTISFTHPDTEINYEIRYSGKHIREIISSDAENSSPALWEVTLYDLPFESDWENTRLKEQLAAKDDEIRELVTSDNKVVADLSRYVETLEQKIADKNDAYRAACAVVAKMHEAAIGEVVGPVLGVVEVVANVREQLIEAQKQIVMLREELATTQSELETERRLSFRNVE